MFPTEALKRISIAGNVAALVTLVVLCANYRTLFEPGPPVVQTHLPAVPPGPAAGRVVLVVVDGLRADVAADPAVMPHLAELARRSGRGTAVVDSLIPSTVAGVASLAGGVTPPPASFLNDFRGRPEAGGGMFAAVAAAGGKSLVAGPALWTDLYGRWVHAAKTTTDLEGNDGPLFDAAVGGLRAGGFRLVDLHLGRTDAAAHRHGGDSAAYRAAARACDEMIGRVADELGPGDAILVTSDHGVTAGGGHAGPEPAVRRTPLVVAGPGFPRGEFGAVRQTDVGRLILRALQIPPAPPPVAPPGDSTTVSFLLIALACGIAAASAVRIGRHLARPGVCRRFTPLCLAVWPALVLLLIGRPWVALALCLLPLAGCARAAGPGAWRRPTFLFAAGGVFGGVRLLDGLLTSAGTLSPVAGGVVYSSVTAVFVVTAAARQRAPFGGYGRRWVGAGLVGILAAWALGRWPLAAAFGVAVAAGVGLGLSLGPARGGGAGLLAAILLTVPARLAGETCSLSTLPVAGAFRFVHLPYGLALAVVAVFLSQWVVPLGFVLGFAPRLAALRPARVGGFAAGAGLGLIGQAVGAGLVLCLGSGDTAVASVALGGLLRVLAETAYLFVGMAAGVVVFAGRHPGKVKPAPEVGTLEG